MRQTPEKIQAFANIQVPHNSQKHQDLSILVPLRAKTLDLKNTFCPGFGP